MMDTQPPVRVLCVEDNLLVAEAIGRKLQHDPGFVWLGYARTAGELMDMVQKHRPDVICMDYDVPGEDTLEMTRALRLQYPEARVMMLTGYVTEELIQQAVDAGVWGYLSKAEESRVIVQALRRVAAGEFVLGKIASQEFAHRAQASDSSQTPRPRSETGTDQTSTVRVWNLLRLLKKH